VDDVAESVLCALQVPVAVNGIVNVGSGVPTSVTEVVTQLARSLGVQPALRVTAEYRLGDIRHNVADITRLRTQLLYTPQINLADGLDRFARWVLTQPLPEDLLDKANAELRARRLMS